MSNDRKSREDSSREATSGRKSRDAAARSETIRKTYNMEYVSKLSLPEGVARDGFEYFWQRFTTAGSSDVCLETSFGEGWEPVPVERCTNKMVTDILCKNENSKKFICKGDVMLLERPTEIGYEERVFNHNRHLERLECSKPFNFNSKKPEASSMGVFDIDQGE